ncbi:hypothetical protein Mpt1_c08480 [Candidatus Methanoplasma termitum]|uniref:Uncharacterized protein n=1 Tax=Candidatus Methanoplasma termitum TaxID=1577791 RepID=A0A0A7LCC9_9ARCH|nr:hypothetical protein [Candidatus Methanoplasma termitum]AIZ56724.1 hypothetical protein Mpt1_c08480 [Candidatus Methanoplasma termitum]
MDTDKAYLIGLVVGGGIWGNAEDVFRIRLPYRQWGSFEEDPQRASLISKDILKHVSPLFRAVYGVSVSYETKKSGEWNILCEGDLTEIRSDLEHYGIKCEGELRKNVEIDKIALDLLDDNLKRRFIAGLADTIASTNSTHRRFTNDKQMVSFEVSGFGFGFVCSLCKLLHSINCFPDQILWNHPNFHCKSNPFYKKWKKGFKIRVYIDQYDKFGSFTFTSKVNSMSQNMDLEAKENTAMPCEYRTVDRPTVSCVHCDENSSLLPETIRNGHYLHNKHVCAVMGCEHAPYTRISGLISNAEDYINPFPVLVKGTNIEISKIIKENPIFGDRVYSKRLVRISELNEIYQKNKNELVFAVDEVAGYPINQVMKAVTFLSAAELGQLGGKRPGKMPDVLDEYQANNPSASVEIMLPDLLTPLILSMGGYSALVGASNPKVYKKLILMSPDNPYKFSVMPIKEEDLR